MIVTILGPNMATACRMPPLLITTVSPSPLQVDTCSQHEKNAAKNAVLSFLMVNFFKANPSSIYLFTAKLFEYRLRK
ncbi:Uncharacterized protein APZ42_029737 [Daphnia magna]|uniref:Uncharacterized protein n=1 Tax=Daphnia magna TaxID=35525 RepID=A0A164PCS9_9CRUS|nr:Uncharacterized protein APZ42_029737 [Daphnia magna]